ncbi:uncharacterized protein LOC142163059 [Nicotiana tabacum]|uniref:Uncharacterized protein LOC142163059 n=1 Tax=Nicotiana tabacum TaxID=4097 RepID=A0AC58RUL8_TOBAC
MYICFHALKMRFKEGLRPFIGLDETFLKGKAKDQLLIVVGLDCNNQTYPLAWAIVDKETKRTWNWLLELLQRSLDLKEGEGITFMSDMQKGLIKAVHTEDFKDQLKSIGKMDKEAAEALLKYPPQAWCRAYFDTVCKNQRVDNNFTESIANRCFVNSNGKFGYEVREEGDTHTINMAMKRCTCRGWDLTGIPCPHAIKAIQYKKMDPMST